MCVALYCHPRANVYLLVLKKPLQWYQDAIVLPDRFVAHPPQPYALERPVPSLEGAYALPEAVQIALPGQTLLLRDGHYKWQKGGTGTLGIDIE
eukprot:2023823-Rhodomonas_salina.1